MSISEASDASILVLVHPGSACGSATFNLGSSQAREARFALAGELDQWAGGLLVIDGALSDELESYPVLDGAIQRALARAKETGCISRRVMGDDPEQLDRITEFVASIPEQDLAVTSFAITGAWYHEADKSGCVGSVHRQLVLLGCKSQVSSGAVRIDPPRQKANTPRVREK